MIKAASKEAPFEDAAAPANKAASQEAPSEEAAATQNSDAAHDGAREPVQLEDAVTAFETFQWLLHRYRHSYLSEQEYSSGSRIAQDALDRLKKIGCRMKSTMRLDLYSRRSSTSQIVVSGGRLMIEPSLNCI